MDADRNWIPIVEDDMGEGFKDLWEEGMVDKNNKALSEFDKRVRENEKKLNKLKMPR